MHLVLMCGGPSLHLFLHYTEAKALRGPCSPEEDEGPPLPLRAERQSSSGGHQEPTEMLSTMLIKHENAISWLINQGKTPPFISEQQPKAFYKRVTWLSVKLREVVKKNTTAFLSFNICYFISFNRMTDVGQLFCPQIYRNCDEKTKIDLEAMSNEKTSHTQ